MPNYIVSAPEGRQYQVNAPEGVSERDVLAYAQANAGESSASPVAGMTRLEKIAAALRKADAAGNVEDARRLAQAYVAERDRNTVPPLPPGFVLEDEQAEQIPPLPPGFVIEGEEAGVPIEVELPDGQVVEFPAGTDTATMERALQQYTRENGQAASGSNVKRVEFPEGSIRRIEVPEGATDEQILAFAQSQYRPDRSQMSVADRYAAAGVNPNQYSATDGQSFGQNMAAGFGKAFSDSGLGFQQLGLSAADYFARSNPALVGQGGREAIAQRMQATQQEIDQRRVRDADLMNTSGGTLGVIAGHVGQMAVPGGAVARAVGTKGVGALAGNVAMGAGFSATQPVATGESRVQNAAVGGLAGGAAHGAVAGLSALGRRAANAVAPEVRQLAGRAQQMGIPLHASQVSQSLPVKVAASAGKYLPFSGYQRAAHRQQEGFNRAVGRTFGADAPRLSDDVMTKARRGLSGQFEEIYNRNAVPLTERAARKLLSIETEASRRLTNDQAQVLRNQMDDILSNADGGVLSGQKYQAVRTKLRKAEGNDKLGLAVRELRMALDDIASESVGPQDAATLKALRSGWANMRTTEKALQQVAGAGGDIRPASLWPLVRNGSTQEMRELARMGQTLLKDPIADSGTAQRSLIYNLLMGGGSLANPSLAPMILQAAAGGATLGRAANSNTLAKLLTRESRGRPTSRLAELIGGRLPALAATAGAQINQGMQVDVSGGQPGAWTPESDAELERLRREMAERRKQRGWSQPTTH
ncbi:hypothetical protein [Lysobacter sp. A3-1-A15]|uniref:hypothetical protein n=1 Tax=Novilysobacter viscosus TaxID=3098602 RepID=UPI002ED8B7B9